MTAQTHASASARSVPWLIIICGCLIAALTFGPRSAMGFFQLPMLQDTGWDRTTFGLAMALQNLAWGVSQPFFGAIADKFGTWRVLLISGLVYALGLFLMSLGTSPLWLHVGGGVLVGLGVGSGSFGILLSAFARNVSAGPTDAKPEIWQRPDDFRSKTQAMKKAADELAKVAAGGDAAAIGKGVKALGDACGDCHESFRKPKEESYKQAAAQ